MKTKVPIKISLLCALNVFLFLFVFYGSQYLSNLPFVIRDFAGALTNKLQQKIFLGEFSRDLEFFQRKFDVLKVDLKIKVLQNAESLEGYMRSKILLLENTDRIVLNFHDNMEVENVLTNQKNVHFVHEKNQIHILFSEYFKAKDTLEVEIKYNGQPRNIGLAGFKFVKEANRFYTLSEPNFAQSWWPCKDVSLDKFLASIEIIVPENIIAISMEN